MDGPVHVRLDDEMITFIDRLVANGRYKDRTDFMREAARELKAQFTGEPTMRTLDGRVKVNEYQIGLTQRNLWKVMEELEIERVK